MISAAYKIAVLISFTLNAAIAFAQNATAPVNPGMLLVSLDEKSVGGSEAEALLELLCESVAPGLTAEHGVFGLGVFTDVECGNKAHAPGETPFRLKLQAGEDSAELTLTTSTVKNPTSIVASIQFKHSGRLLELLEEDAFASMLAAALIDQMPLQIRFDGKSRVKRHEITKGEQALLDTKTFTLPSAFYAFTGSVDDSGVIYPSVLGRIALKSRNAGEASYLHESGGGNNTVVWRLETKAKKLPSAIYGISTGARSDNGALMQEQVSQLAARLIEDINQNVLTKSAKVLGEAFGGGFLGLRYGPALLEGDLIDQSKYFGALVEFRSGWLDGLRIYYDYWPEVSGTINGQYGTFGGKRTILAYSLAIKFDSWIRTIDVTPKAGLWSFRSKAPIELEPGVYVSPEFEVKKAPSFDLELGIETASSIHILRGWISRAATFLSTGKNDAKITSSRVGMDLLLSPWGATSPVTVSLLSFYFFEAVELNKSQKVEGEDAELDQLNYSQAYAGGGLAISW